MDHNSSKRRCKFCTPPHDMDTGAVLTGKEPGYSDGVCDKARERIMERLKTGGLGREAWDAGARFWINVDDMPAGPYTLAQIQEMPNAYELQISPVGQPQLIWTTLGEFETKYQQQKPVKPVMVPTAGRKPMDRENISRGAGLDAQYEIGTMVSGFAPGQEAGKVYHIFNGILLVGGGSVDIDRNPDYLETFQGRDAYEADAVEWLYNVQWANGSKSFNLTESEIGAMVKHKDEIELYKRQEQGQPHTLPDFPANTSKYGKNMTPRQMTHNAAGGKFMDKKAFEGEFKYDRLKGYNRSIGKVKPPTSPAEFAVGDRVLLGSYEGDPTPAIVTAVYPNIDTIDADEQAYSWVYMIEYEQSGTHYNDDDTATPYTEKAHMEVTDTNWLSKAASYKSIQKKAEDADPGRALAEAMDEYYNPVRGPKFKVGDRFVVRKIETVEPRYQPLNLVGKGGIVTLVNFNDDPELYLADVAGVTYVVLHESQMAPADQQATTSLKSLIQKKAAFYGGYTTKAEMVDMFGTKMRVEAIGEAKWPRPEPSPWTYPFRKKEEVPAPGAANWPEEQKMVPKPFPKEEKDERFVNVNPEAPEWKRIVEEISDNIPVTIDASYEYIPESSYRQAPWGEPHYQEREVTMEAEEPYIENDTVYVLYSGDGMAGQYSFEFSGMDPDSVLEAVLKDIEDGTFENEVRDYAD
jgi:hypothetical protein